MPIGVSHGMAVVYGPKIYIIVGLTEINSEPCVTTAAMTVALMTH